MADDSKLVERDKYDAKAVDRLFHAARWLHEKRLSNPLHYLALLAIVPPHFVLGMILNRVKIHGKERLPRPGQGFFLLSNHISMIDGQMLGMSTLPRTYWFPSKAAFYRNTLGGAGYFLATAFKTFPVRRGERDDRAGALIEDLLRRGDSVLLFPEGTRSKDGQLLPGKPGVGKIIHDSRPLVVPAYVEGLDSIVRPGKLLPRVGKRGDVIFGHPLPLDDLFDRPPGRETSQAIVDRVMDAIAALRDELHRERG